MDRQELQMLLSRLEPVTEPDVSLEQYPTPPDIAADVLWQAYMSDDLGGTVLDLGCGNGILGLGAAVLGAAAMGVDVDGDAVAVAKENADLLAEQVEHDLATQFMIGDVRTVALSADTVVMNPPFGIQSENANLPFIETAVSVAPVVYALLHRSQEKQDETRAFIGEVAARQDASTQVLGSFQFPVPRLFAFHEKEQEEVQVDLYKFER